MYIIVARHHHCSIHNINIMLLTKFNLNYTVCTNWWRCIINGRIMHSKWLFNGGSIAILSLHAVAIILYFFMLDVHNWFWDVLAVVHGHQASLNNFRKKNEIYTHLGNMIYKATDTCTCSPVTDTFVSFDMVCICTTLSNNRKYIFISIIFPSSGDILQVSYNIKDLRNRRMHWSTMSNSKGTIKCHSLHLFHTVDQNPERAELVKWNSWVNWDDMQYHARVSTPYRYWLLHTSEESIYSHHKGASHKFT